MGAIGEEGVCNKPYIQKDAAVLIIDSRFYTFTQLISFEQDEN